MMRNGGRSIVNIGSISGTTANRVPSHVHYNAAKAWGLRLTRFLPARHPT